MLLLPHLQLLDESLHVYCLVDIWQWLAQSHAKDFEVNSCSDAVHTTTSYTRLVLNNRIRASVCNLVVCFPLALTVLALRLFTRLSTDMPVSRHFAPRRLGSSAANIEPHSHSHSVIASGMLQYVCVRALGLCAARDFCTLLCHNLWSIRLFELSPQLRSTLRVPSGVPELLELFERVSAYVPATSSCSGPAVSAGLSQRSSRVMQAQLLTEAVMQAQGHTPSRRMPAES